MSEPIRLRLPLPRRLPPVLGVGAYLKNALCLIQDDEAWIGADNGSLDTVAATEAFLASATGLLAAARTTPVALAHDWHPDFFCTRWAMEQETRTIGIQHHHAHTAAVMAEYGLDQPVLGVSLDGFGLGEDNAAWGGELLRVDADGYRRLGHLYPLPQLGGDRAAREPWRMGAAALWAMGRGEEIATRYATHNGAGHLAGLMDRGVNAPMTTSAGRLFDAACGLLGVKPVATFEGEAPMALEAMAQERLDSGIDSRLDSRIESRIDFKNGMDVLDLRPLLAVLCDYGAAEGAVLFHLGLVAALSDWIEKVAQQAGIKDIILSGGCFLNKILASRLSAELRQRGLTPRLPVRMMPSDTSLALGQAYAAALLLEREG